MSQKKVNLGVREVPKPLNWISFSLQHLFAMFGATILVPKLVGLSPGVALITSGLGTLAYYFFDYKRTDPGLLRFILWIYCPDYRGKSRRRPWRGHDRRIYGRHAYGLIALLIQQLGTDWLMRLLPPVVVCPVIIVIGLGLASTAVNMAM